jgi:hypothetical protein
MFFKAQPLQPLAEHPVHTELDDFLLFLKKIFTNLNRT